MNEVSWTNLIEDVGSPLHDKHMTFFFKNIDMLSNEYQRQLLTMLKGLNIKESNRFLFSCSYTKNKIIPLIGHELMKVLSCLTVKIPPLRERTIVLPIIANSYLRQLNSELGKQIIGFDVEALDLIKQYPWQANYTQFKRVINELAVITTTPYISAEYVKKILAKEDELYVQRNFGETHNGGIAIDINQPLKLIEKEIVKMVVKANHDNQTVAAKKLRICRTTLWRYLNED